jgi:amidase
MTVVKKPTPDELKEVARSQGMNLSDEDIASYLELMTGTVDNYNRLAEMPNNIPPVKYARTPGYFPGGADNPNNAWYVKSRIDGAPSGKLKGKTIAL